MKTFCRKSYNLQYYSQNRERILKRRQRHKDGLQEVSQTHDHPSQLSLFEFSTPQISRQNSIQRFNADYILNCLLFLLVIANSYYLLGEAVEFYQANDTGVETSWLAAVSVELLLLALSVIQTTSAWLKVAAKTALVLLFLYSAWSLCSSVISRGYGAIEQISGLERQIERLEARIKERDQLIAENLKIRRVTMARRLTLEKDSLNEQLSAMENERLKHLAVPPKSIWINTLSMVALRLLLQLSNIIIVHHLAGHLRKTPKRPTSRLARAAPVIQLVRRLEV